eukprot:1159720-Pelagomonas_calceolata.AAC.8
MHSISQTTEAMRKRVAEASMLSLEVSKDRLQQGKCHVRAGTGCARLFFSACPGLGTVGSSRV